MVQIKNSIVIVRFLNCTLDDVKSLIQHACKFLNGFSGFTPISYEVVIREACQNRNHVKSQPNKIEYKHQPRSTTCETFANLHSQFTAAVGEKINFPKICVSSCSTLKVDDNDDDDKTQT